MITAIHWLIALPLLAGQPTVSSARISSKGVAKLVFLSGPNFPGDPCWRPDGSPATAADLKLGEGSHITTAGGTSSRRRVNLFFDIEGLNTEARAGVHLRFDPGPNAHVNGNFQGERSPGFLPQMIPKGQTGTYIPPTTQVLSTTTFEFPSDRDQADIRLGVAAAPFKLAAHAKPGAAPLYPVVKPLIKSAGSTTDPTTGKMVTTRTEFSSVTSVTVNIPTRWVDKDCRISAYDAGGHALQRLPSLDIHLGLDGEVKQRSFNFITKSKSDIALIKLEVRDFKWVKFSAIHLHGNKAR